MLPLARTSCRPAKTQQLSQLQLRPQPACMARSRPSIQSRSYPNVASGGNQRELRPINTALLAAGSPWSFCPSGPVRSQSSYHNLFSARPITFTTFFSSTLRKPLLPCPLLDSSDIDKACFSTSRPVMGATKIDGTAIAKRIREGLHAEILDKKKINPRFVPSLKIIQGDYPPNQPAFCPGNLQTIKD